MGDVPEQRLPGLDVQQRRLSVQLIIGGGALLLVGAIFGAARAVAPDHTSSADTQAVGVPGEVDIGFSQDMVVHHHEIGMMSGWLALWHAPPVRSGPSMAWMPGHAGGRCRDGDFGRPGRGR
ncbi:hypothetical protein [Sporichthya polymorpha]|uniref:hypothetical protein n=1 Tax=Sporichthya polymorpha TaxID=35751 RepID=UPI00146D74A8|nr:hypothetical protein [Sporichthya polymorpha]